MTAHDLTPTERAVRIIVAQHLPGVGPDRATSYAERIHLKTPLTHLGLSDGYFAAATVSIERAYGFEATDDAWEACKSIADLVALVLEHQEAEAAA
jgi:hypothetical protein